MAYAIRINCNDQGKVPARPESFNVRVIRADPMNDEYRLISTDNRSDFDHWQKVLSESGVQFEVVMSGVDDAG